MSSLSISAAWDESRAILTRDGRLLLSVALALIVLPQTILAVIVPTAQAGTGVGTMPMVQLLLFASLIIGFAAQIALNRLALGPSVTVGGAIGRGFIRLLPLLGALLILCVVLVIVAVMVAAALAVAGLVAPPRAGAVPSPGLIITLVVLTAFTSAIFQLMIPVAAAESGGPIHLLVRSWRLARPEYPRLLGFVCIVFFGIAVLFLVDQFAIGSVILLLLGQPRPGSISSLVFGLTVAILQAGLTVVTAVMLARIYLQLAGRGATQASVPSSGT